MTDDIDSLGTSATELENQIIELGTEANTREWYDVADLLDAAGMAAHKVIVLLCDAAIASEEHRTDQQNQA